MPKPWPDLHDAVEIGAVLRALTRTGMAGTMSDAPFTMAEVSGWTGEPDRFSWALITFLTRAGVLLEIPNTDPVRFEFASGAADLLARVDRWDSLAAVLTGSSSEVNLDQSEAASSHYPRMVGQMLAIGRKAAPNLEELLPAHENEPGSLLILEPGGAAGTWSVPLVEAHRGRSSVVLDLPAVVDVARALDHPAEVDFVAADILRIPWARTLPGGRCDVVLLANVLHLFDDEKCKHLVRQAGSVLTPNGRLIVVDVFRDATPGYWTARYGLSLRLRTTSGGVWSTDEVDDWCRRLGLTRASAARAVAPKPPLTALTYSRNTSSSRQS